MSSSQDQSGGFAERFNDNVEYTQRKTGQRDRNTSFRPTNEEIDRNAQQSSETSTTEERGWHSGSKYSYTARDLVHPDEHTSPDE